MNSVDLSSALSNSLSLGSILVLTALGLAITFGVMRVINMAHGDMLMLGAYTAYVVQVFFPRVANGILQPIFGADFSVQDHADLNIYIAIPVSFVVVGLFGYLLEVCLIRFLYGRPLDTLLATWGVSMIVQQTALIVSHAFGADRAAMQMPEGLKESWEILGVNIPVYRIFIVGVTAFCLAGVYVWFFRTTFGLKIRAVVQNRAMASAVGISTRRVDSLTFAFATGLAGVAGCIMAYQYNIAYNMGSDYIVQAFMVVILGGMGYLLTGSITGGVLIGASSSFLTKVLGSSWAADFGTAIGFPASDWAQAVGNNSESMSKVGVLLVVVAFVLIRPAGLFVTRERSYD
jgi:urea transport system permease protein